MWPFEKIIPKPKPEESFYQISGVEIAEGTFKKYKERLEEIYSAAVELRKN